MYRVVETITTGFTNPTTIQNVLWRGYDVNKLNKLFPVDDILGDQLVPYTTDSGYVRHDFRFERYDILDVWIRCDDPRRASQEAELENGIDLEDEINLFNSGGLVLGRSGYWT
jgi:hypothetical protein